jgi:uncharacterized protein YceH (UPF0502 family)
MLPRQPGSREARYAHLLGNPPYLFRSRPNRSHSLPTPPHCPTRG